MASAQPTVRNAESGMRIPLPPYVPPSRCVSLFDIDVDVDVDVERERERESEGNVGRRPTGNAGGAGSCFFVFFFFVPFFFVVLPSLREREREDPLSFNAG